MFEQLGRLFVVGKIGSTGHTCLIACLWCHLLLCLAKKTITFVSKTLSSLKNK